MQNLLRSTVGRKLLLGLTGVGVSGFAFFHMSTNLLLLKGAEAYNTAAHQLAVNPQLLLIAEIGLLVLFWAHVLLAVSVSWTNWKASGKGSLSGGFSAKRGNFASRTMVMTGLLVLAFLVLHLKDFRFGEVTLVTYNGVEMRDLYTLVAAKFMRPERIALYCFAVCVLGLHLSHGAASIFQSLGIGRVKERWAVGFARIFALLITLGFLAQPLYFFLRGQ